MTQDKKGLFDTSSSAGTKRAENPSSQPDRKFPRIPLKIVAAIAFAIVLPWLFGLYPLIPKSVQFPQIMGHRMGTIDEVATATSSSAKAAAAGAAATSEARSRGDQEVATQRQMIAVEVDKATAVARATQQIQVETAGKTAAIQSLLQQIEQRQSTCVASVQQTADSSFSACMQRPRGSEGGACDVERTLQLERVDICRATYDAEMAAAGLKAGERSQ